MKASKSNIHNQFSKPITYKKIILFHHNLSSFMLEREIYNHNHTFNNLNFKFRHEWRKLTLKIWILYFIKPRILESASYFSKTPNFRKTPKCLTEGFFLNLKKSISFLLKSDREIKNHSRLLDFQRFWKNLMKK